jgi:hypothetical protein
MTANPVAMVQAAFFLIFGFGLLGLDFQSLSKGSLPCGPNGLKGRVEFSRRDQPVLYWLMFSVYGAGGLWLIVHALRLLSGAATPLPIR